MADVIIPKSITVTQGQSILNNTNQINLSELMRETVGQSGAPSFGQSNFISDDIEYSYSSGPLVDLSVLGGSEFAGFLYTMESISTSSYAAQGFITINPAQSPLWLVTTFNGTVTRKLEIGAGDDSLCISYDDTSFRSNEVDVHSNGVTIISNENSTNAYSEIDMNPEQLQLSNSTGTGTIVLSLLSDCGDGTPGVKIAGLPIYADEAAAISGGLQTDCVYKTGNGEFRIKL